MNDRDQGFDPNKADKLLDLAEEIFDDEQQAALHFAAGLMGLVPDLKYAEKLCQAQRERIYGCSSSMSELSTNKFCLNIICNNFKGKEIKIKLN